jgi:hypothetical protein
MGVFRAPFLKMHALTPDGKQAPKCYNELHVLDCAYDDSRSRVDRGYEILVCRRDRYVVSCSGNRSKGLSLDRKADREKRSFAVR